MEYVRVERLDHLGVVASVIKDLGLIEMIDARLLLHDQAEITAGEAIAGMILNGLGFSNRPLSLTPQFFANKPLDLLFREGLRAEMFNRFNPTTTLTHKSFYFNRMQRFFVKRFAGFYRLNSLKFKRLSKPCISNTCL